MLSKLVFGDNVLGVIMPNGIQSDIDDAIQVCKTLNIKYKIVNIECAFKQLINVIESPEDSNFNDVEFVYDNISDKAKTNIPPRLRMTTLYAIAQTLGYRVIGTGNASERYIGWFTKYGDGGCDLNPIAHLTCTEVIELGKELCKEFNLPIDLIVKKPADGLTGKSDEENFGFTYKQLDDYIRFVDGSGNTEVDEKIEKLHKYSEHKLKMPYTLLKDGRLVD
jgi:NAD+ synthase